MIAVDLQTIKQTETQKKAQRSRSIAIALALVAFVVLVYVVSIVKLGSHIFERTM